MSCEYCHGDGFGNHRDGCPLEPEEQDEDLFENKEDYDYNIWKDDLLEKRYERIRRDI